MLRELRVSELRYRAVLEVLDGASVTEVAHRFGVSRQTVHVWLRRYAGAGGAVNLEDRSSRPHGCPHQLPVVVEARLLEVRDAHPGWGADRIRYQLEHDGMVVVPSRSAVYRALVRNGRIDPTKRRRRRADYRRWERGRPMELWQMDVVGGIHLADRVEVKAVTGIDDNSRFIVSAMLTPRATARPVCEALLAALRRHGIPEQILTDNGKVFTGRFGPRGSTTEVLFDRVCVENGIKHLLTAPRSPTTTGKVPPHRRRGVLPAPRRSRPRRRQGLQRQASRVGGLLQLPATPRSPRRPDPVRATPPKDQTLSVSSVRQVHTCRVPVDP